MTFNDLLSVEEALRVLPHDSYAREVLLDDKQSPYTKAELLEKIDDLENKLFEAGLELGDARQAA